MSAERGKRGKADPTNRETSGMAVELPPPPFPWTSVALACTLVAAVCAGMLALEHFGGLTLPGCGVGSPCAKAAASKWGRLPAVGFPVSLVGLAFFIAMVGGLIAARRNIGSGLVWLARLGAGASAFFIVVSIVDRLWCPYCLVAHGANLVAWAAIERASRRRLGPVRGAGIALATLAVALGALVAADVVTRKSVQARGESQRVESTRQIAERGSHQPTTTADPTKPAASSQAPFTGRFRLGPERAPIRIVLFIGYQCPDCKLIENEAIELVNRRTDVSLSVKHFPLCNQCNPHMGTSNPHPNGCWAARAAEAAGILRGNDGFWAMHRWLFDQRGSFTDESLPAALQSLGFDPAVFTQMMTSDQTLQRVRADIDEAVGLGIYYTPMIFVNGVELKGWFTPRALTRTVEELTTKNLPALGPESDRPAQAAEKYIADWREGQIVNLLARPADASWALGAPAERAKPTVVVFGDYLEPLSAEADALTRSLLGDRALTGPAPTARYEFRLYPLNKDCNPGVGFTKNALACRAAATAVAAGRLKGATGFWAAHDRLLKTGSSFSESTIDEVAAAVGVPPDALRAEVSRPETLAVVQADTAAGQAAGVRGVPAVFVNTKQVPRWKREGDDVLKKIFDEAGR